MDYARVYLLQEFQQRFNGLYDNYLWLTLLDPRFGKNLSHRKCNEELRHAEVQELAIIVVEKTSPNIDYGNKTRCNEGRLYDEKDEFSFEILAPRKSDSKKIMKIGIQ